MDVLFKILFVIAFTAFFLCVCVFVGGLFMGLKENGLPDLEDV